MTLVAIFSILKLIASYSLNNFLILWNYFYQAGNKSFDSENNTDDEVETDNESDSPVKSRESTPKKRKAVQDSHDKLDFYDEIDVRRRHKQTKRTSRAIEKASQINEISSVPAFPKKHLNIGSSTQGAIFGTSDQPRCKKSTYIPRCIDNM